MSAQSRPRNVASSAMVEGIRERMAERVETCPDCRGWGVEMEGRWVYGYCDRCLGTGKIVVPVKNPSLWNKLMRIFGGVK